MMVQANRGYHCTTRLHQLERRLRMEGASSGKILSAGPTAVCCMQYISLQAYALSETAARVGILPVDHACRSGVGKGQSCLHCAGGAFGRR